MTGGLWDNGTRGECTSRFPASRTLWPCMVHVCRRLSSQIPPSFLRPGPYASVLKDLLKLSSSDFALVKYEDLWAAEQRQLGRGWASIGYWVRNEPPCACFLIATWLMHSTLLYEMYHTEYCTAALQYFTILSSTVLHSLLQHLTECYLHGHFCVGRSGIPGSLGEQALCALGHQGGPGGCGVQKQCHPECSRGRRHREGPLPARVCLETGRST